MCLLAGVTLITPLVVIVVIIVSKIVTELGTYTSLVFTSHSSVCILDLI